jgi:cysteine synthase A
MLSSGIEQQRNADGSAAVAHPSWKPHPMQGWSPDFIAKLTGDAVASKAISEVLRIENAEALKWSKELAK